MISICHILTGFQRSGKVYFETKIHTPLKEVEWILKSREDSALCGGSVIKRGMEVQ